jgi:hypothetical protein
MRFCIILVCDNSACLDNTDLFRILGKQSEGIFKKTDDIEAELPLLSIHY